MAQQPTQQDLLSVLRKSAVIIQKQEQALAAYHEPLAIVGMGCRYPGAADTPTQFWQNLLAGLDSVGFLSDPRAKDLYGGSTDALRAAVRSADEAKMAAYALRGGFLERVDEFDPAFFGLSPREVLVMDPAHRLLLETTWQALEDANLVPATLFNTEVGVFIGNGLSGYAQFCEGEEDNLYTATGNTPSTAAGRISYLLGLTGPCISLDTACSSSLTAIHLACQSLRTGECNTALAGGVNVILEANSTSLFANGNMLSGEARCKSFDAAADGYVRGEGCGMLVLKRLSDAQANGDRILAVIRGTAVNQDGPSSGLTVPNGPAQERVIRRALADGKLKPEQVGYIEAHGTGTPLGDPIEIGALGAVFGERQQPLYVGSVKTNIGHLEMAAGVAGLMKLVLAIQHGQLPPHLHFQTPNPHIDWAATPVRVPTAPTPWPLSAAAGERIGGVSSFGFSGTNAHIVISQAPSRRSVETSASSDELLTARPILPPLQLGAGQERTAHLLTLSAKSEQSLHAYVQRYLDLLATHPDVDLGDLCYTNHIGRSHFAHRLGLAASSVPELRQQLAAFAVDPDRAGVCYGLVPTNRLTTRLAFLFTGQGSQYVGMGRELYASSNTFRAALDRCEELYREATGESLLAVLYPPAEVSEGSALEETTYTQPALFALEYALATLWQSWGVQPDYLMGHSVGEVAAACVAGVFSLADGMKLIAARGRLMGELPGDGAMIAVTATEAAVQQAIATYKATTERVDVAAVNGPTQVVLSGQREAVYAVAALLTGQTGAESTFAQGAASIKALRVSHAFHSPLMAPMLNDFRQVAASITYHPPTLPLIANITGTLAGADIATADYWVRHVREAVRFADGMATLRGQGVTIFLEIGPKPTLLGLAQMEYEGRGPAQEEADKMDASHAAHRSPRWLPSLRQNHSDWQQMLISLGMLYTQGARIDWVALDQDWPRHKIELPTYPFQRQRYWPTASTRRQASAMLRPLIDRQVKLPAKRETLFETALSVAALPFLADHRVYGTVVVPGACHLALVLSAAELTFGGSSYGVSDLIFPQPLMLAQEQVTHTVQLLCQSQPVQAGERLLTFQLLSFVDSTTEDEPATTLHATGVVGPAKNTLLHEPTLAEHQALCTEAIAADFYTAMSESAAMYFGPTFQWLDGCWQQPTLAMGHPFQLLVRLRRPAVVDRLAGYIIHPGLLDGCFQAAGLAQQWVTGSTELQLPFALTTASVTAVETGNVWWCHLEQSGAQWQIRLFDELGQMVARFDGFQLRAAPPATLQSTRLPTEWLYTIDWEASPLTATTSLFQPDCWWVVGGSDALQRQLIEQLHRPECSVIVAASETTLQEQITALAATRHRVGVIYLGNATATNRNVAEATHQLCTDLLHLTQALLASTLSVRLWIVTENCQMQDKRAPEHRMCAEATAGGALWGMGRTIAQEQPQWHPVCLDLDSSLAVEQQATLLQAELQGAPTDTAPMTEIAYQQQNRHVAHLAPWQTFDATLPQRLQLQAYGALEHLHFVPLQRRAPAAGEIEIAVKAAGLNFRDLLNALGLLQEYYATVFGVTQASAVSLGFECAGVVTAVGKGVSTLAVGDRVMGLTGFTSAFATHVTLPAAQMVAIPASFTEEEAATLPLAFLTAWYGLVELAQLQPGQRVLIHAASGGVGQAAVQIAHARGAEVFATASPGKWEFLRRQGVTHIFHSRTLHFTKELLHCTNGQGVDVVLNSLNGDFIAHTLATLGEGGRFIEIGKLGIWSTEQMAQARPDVVYHSFDLGEAIAQEPSLQARLWGAITEQLQTGALHPLPYRAFGAQEAVSAFRYMQQARQMGKVVLTFAAPELLTLQPNATYLVTGGLGGLGIAIAQQLVADGARQLILTSRRGVTTAEQQQVLDQLTAAGANVQVVSADIGDRSAVQALLERCTAIAPLRGIVHAAGVLEDGMLASQTPARFAAVLRPKVDGAWHLHTLTDGMNLEFFIAFSSIAALLGSPGQSNYAAANAFLDTLMQQRRQMGLAGLSINWGPWSEVGMAAHLHDRLQQQGMALISPQQGRLFFQYLLAQTKANLSGQVGIFPSCLTPADTQTPLQRTTVRDLLAALPPSERKARLEHSVRSELAAVLRINPNTPLDAYTRLFDFGLDSLMAVELKNKLEMQLDCTLRATVIFDYPTLAVLLPYLYHDILGYTEAPALPLEKPAGGVQQNLEALSSQELDDLLEQELAFLEK